MRNEHFGDTRCSSPARGFTYIEVLIAIAILGILASIVLVSLNTSRTKAKNSRIQTDVRQMRIAAEDMYDTNQGAGFCPGSGSPCAETDPGIELLKRDINEQNGRHGGEPDVYADVNFCVSAHLADGNVYCSDSTGRITGTFQGGPGGGTCDTATQLCEGS